jgi:anti-sigma factor (TIGR02949 family)
MSIFDRLRQLFGGESSNGADGQEMEMISCEDALNLIHEFIDGELGDVSSEQVKAHFDVCGRCYPHLQLEESFRAAVRKAAAGEQAPPELRSRLMDLLAEATTEE